MNNSRFFHRLFFSVSLLLHFGAGAVIAGPESASIKPSSLSWPQPAKLAEKPPESPSDLRLDRYEFAIKAFEFKDRRWPPPQGTVVFIGSSTFTKWRDLETTFAEFKAINRGFGGATIPEVNHYVSRIVTKYNPTKVVFYCGSNDLAELHHDGKQVFADFKTFVQLVHEKLPTCQIYFISESAAPSRENLEKEFSNCNSLVKAYVKTNPHLHYVDVLPVMRDNNGKLREELFGWDHLHMNSAGYALWTPIIRAALTADK